MYRRPPPTERSAEASPQRQRRNLPASPLERGRPLPPMPPLDRAAPGGSTSRQPDGSARRLGPFHTNHDSTRAHASTPPQPLARLVCALSHSHSLPPPKSVRFRQA